MIEEVVGLGFERVGADREDGVGEFGILVAVVEFADAHVARRVDLGIVGRAIVNADVLDLHRAEIELARAPGVLVAATGAAMVEGRDEEAVLTLLVDDRNRDPGDEVERIVPARRLHLAIAPDHRVGEPLQLGVALAAVAHLGDAGAADRTETGVDDAVLVRLDDDMHVAAVLLDDVVHRGRVPGRCLRILLLRQVDAELVVRRGGSALLVHVPRIGVIAAADDAVVANDIVLLGIRGDDRKLTDLTLVSHLILPQSTLESRP